MPQQKKSYFIKGDPAYELLAIQLFNDSGEYASGWSEVSETTRNVFRKIARGDKPLSTEWSKKRADENRERDRDDDHDC